MHLALHSVHGPQDPVCAGPLFAGRPLVSRLCSAGYKVEMSYPALHGAHPGASFNLQQRAQSMCDAIVSLQGLHIDMLGVAEISHTFKTSLLFFHNLRKGTESSLTLSRLHSLKLQQYRAQVAVCDQSMGGRLRTFGEAYIN